MTDTAKMKIDLAWNPSFWHHAFLHRGLWGPAFLQSCLLVIAMLCASSTATANSHTVLSSASAWQSDQSLETAKKYVEKGQYLQAITLIKALEAENVGSIEFHLAAAQLYLDAAKGEDAVNSVIKARNAGANFDRSALLLAKAYLVQRQFTQALNAIKDTRFLPEELYEAALVQADANLSLGNRDAAEALYRQAMVRDRDRYEAYLGLARMALQARVISDAEGLASLALEKAPNETMVHYTIGLIKRYRGRFDEALEHFNVAIDLFPANSLALLERAAILINKDQIAAAEKDLDVVYVYSPSNQMAYYLTAVILARKGEFEEADRVLIKADDLVKRYLPATYVKGLVAYERGQYAIAESYLRRVVNYRPDTISLLRALAITYLKQQKYQSALNVLAPYMKTDRGAGDPVALNLAGIANMGLGNAQQGLLQFEEAVRLGGDRVAASANDPIAEIQGKLALAKYAAGRIDEAYADFEKSAATGKIRDLAILATVYLREKEISKAILTTQDILARYPERAIGYNIMGSIQMAQNQYDMAIANFKKALERNTDYVAAKRNIALCYIKQGQYNQAEGYLRQVAATVKNDYRLVSLLAKSLFEQNKIKEAIPYFRQAYRELSNAPELTADFSEALLKGGQSEEAVQVARKGVSTYANQPNIIKRLGLVLMNAGDVLQATQVFARVIAFTPDDIESQLLYARSLTKARLFVGARNSFTKIEAFSRNRNIQVKGLAWYQAELEFAAQRFDRVELLVPSLIESERPSEVPAYLYGVILNHFKRYAEAEAYLEARYYEDQSDYAVLNHLVSAKMALGDEQASIKLLQGYIQKNQGAIQPVIKLAEIFQKQGQVERAINQYQAVFDMGIIDADISAKLARLLLTRDRFKAETMAAYALDVKPRDPYVLSTYGLYVLRVKRNPGEALGYFNKAIARAPSVAENYYFKGLTLKQLNSRKEAADAFRIALKLSQDFDGVNDAKRQLTLLE